MYLEKVCTWGLRAWRTGLDREHWPKNRKALHLLRKELQGILENIVHGGIGRR